jgi:hypothetical protein
MPAPPALTDGGDIAEALSDPTPPEEGWRDTAPPALPRRDQGIDVWVPSVHGAHSRHVDEEHSPALSS